MLAVAGTVPREDFPLVEGEARLAGERLLVAGHEVPVRRGTPALLAAALACGRGPVHAFLAGDIGRGGGSRELYAHLARVLPGRDYGVLAFHYCLPDVDGHGRVLVAVEAMQRRPLLVADAGFMYAAKMSGLATAYDLFTPDAGELAFLADEKAPHPFYTRGFILQEEGKEAELVARAYAHDNAARHLLVKGRVDHLADAGGVWGQVDRPSLPAMEAMGGTGDTLTGLAAALLAGGLAMRPALRLAARANRLAGELAGADPATQIAELIANLPLALERAAADPAQPAGPLCP